MISKRFFLANWDIPALNLLVDENQAFSNGILQPQWTDPEPDGDETFHNIRQYWALSAQIQDITVVVHPINNPPNKYKTINLIAGDPPFPQLFDYIVEAGSSDIGLLINNLEVCPY